MKKIVISAIVAVLMLFVYLISTFAWTSFKVSVANNIYRSGDIQVQIVPTTKAGSEKVIDVGFIEPGATFKGTFEVRNVSDMYAADDANIGDRIYYKVYLKPSSTSDTSLQDYITVKLIKNGQTVYEGNVSGLTKDKADWIGPLDIWHNDDINPIKDQYEIQFHMDPSIGNGAQNKEFNFDIEVEATQDKNRFE